ncbi:hypothetical protein [Ruminococcus flavefaciens]|jgi:hypothetical protein|uniref:hypothetical protein n=1 Tax=Ruminococcus flavefaciens TaxID=1265 RepID=UPI0004644F5F|nr:hypothetical protein [Ruminococcus flavefaciens]
MSWGRFEQNYVYNYDINACLDAVMRTGAQLKLNVKAADRNAYRVIFSNGISLTTWGEKIHIALGVLPDGRTGINIASVSNLGTEITAKSRNQKNVYKFIETLNTFLPQR